MPAPRIAVVGAGMAGLAAAHRLRVAGAEVVLVERGALGGRAQEREERGFRIESAPLLLGARDRTLHRLAESLPSAAELPFLRPLATAQLHAGELCPTDAADLAGLRRLPGMPLREGFRLLRLARLVRRFESLLGADQPEHATRLDDRSVADFVRLYFGDAVLARWSAPLLAADLGLECADTSRVALLRHYVGRAELGLGRLRTSVGTLASQLARDARFVTGDVRGVRAANAGYELTLASGARVEADAIVLALPPHEALRAAADLLVQPERDFLAASRAEPAIVASFACEGSLVPHSLWVRIPADAGLPLASAAFEPGAERGFAPPGRTLVQLVATPRFSRAHLATDDDAIVRSLAGALERVRPAAARSAEPLAIQRFAWARPRFDVGRYRALAQL
ncbi:MAG TPA: FAD-dependent oxidoreductase, partial [Myxococcota bacterium]|nr:FAD-dependent oxidoreductase [Myxococcota bacterium]